MTAFLAQPLKAPAESLFVVAVALWTGAVVFYSLLVLPTLFASMPSARAGEVAALVFPRYYHGGLLLGAAMLLSRSEETPATLRRNVTSKGGTTAAGLAVFEAAGFTDLVAEVVAAATERSRQLGGG